MGWGDDSDSGGGGNSANTAQVSSTRCRVIKPSAVCAADMFRIAVGFLMEISSGWDMTGYPGPGWAVQAGHVSGYDTKPRPADPDEARGWGTKNTVFLRGAALRGSRPRSAAPSSLL